MKTLKPFYTIRTESGLIVIQTYSFKVAKNYMKKWGKAKRHKMQKEMKGVDKVLKKPTKRPLKMV